MALMGRTSPFSGKVGKVRRRRVSPVASRPGEGLLTERTAGVQPVRRERVFMPHSGRSALGQCSVKMNLLGQAAQRVQATVFKT